MPSLVPSGPGPVTFVQSSSPIRSHHNHNNSPVESEIDTNDLEEAVALAGEAAAGNHHLPNPISFIDSQLQASMTESARSLLSSFDARRNLPTIDRMNAHRSNPATFGSGSSSQHRHWHHRRRSIGIIPEFTIGSDSPPQTPWEEVPSEPIPEEESSFRQAPPADSSQQPAREEPHNRSIFEYIVPNPAVVLPFLPPRMPPQQHQDIASERRFIEMERMSLELEREALAREREAHAAFLAAPDRARDMDVGRERLDLRPARPAGRSRILGLFTRVEDFKDSDDDEDDADGEEEEEEEDSDPQDSEANNNNLRSLYSSPAINFQ